MSNTYEMMRGTAADANEVRKNLIAFNLQNVPNDVYEEVNLCLKDSAGRLIAGLNSVICWNWMEIDILWVDEACRGQGLGQRLLEEAESIARSNDCTFIKLNTFSFQAPEFYEKYGFKIIATFENAPTGYTHYYLKKDLH